MKDKKFASQCIQTSILSLNKYFESKNSWGCRPNSNYLLASVVLGKSTTHIWNTHVNCTACRHTKHVHAVAYAHAQIYTQLTTHLSHTHTHTVHAQQVYTWNRHTASTDCHSYHRQKNLAWDSSMCLGPFAVAIKCLTKAEGSSFVYNTAHHCWGQF